MSVLFLAYAREAVCDGLVTTYETLFNDRVEIKFAGYTSGSNQVTNFPLLVTLAENSPAGFSYARSRSGDLRFLYTAKDKTVEAVPYNVDLWDTNGTSTVWVRVPYLNNNSNIKLTMYWAPDDPTQLPANSPRAVWDGCAAVWHMNGADDSSPNGVAATAGGTVASYAGKIGRALGTRASTKGGAVLRVAPGSPVDAITNGAYTVSGWLRVGATGGNSVWLYTARTNGTDAAYGALLASETDGLRLKSVSGAGQEHTWANTLPADEWFHFAVTHEAAAGVHRLYVNGRQYESAATEWEDVSAAKGFSLGGLAGDLTLNGDLDEVRVYPTALPPRWVTNDYVQATSPGYVAFTNFVSTGKSVYVSTKDKTGGDDPSPESTGAVSPDDYAGTAVMVPSGMAEGVALTNFVTLVTVTKGDPAGFDPKALPFGTEDIRFFDGDGNVLPFEVDTFDTDDVSSFWVLVPRLASSTRITMCWGLKSGRSLPANDPKSVWSGYAGVWHLSDETNAVDGTAGTFGPNALVSGYGQIGRAAGTQVSGQKGAILDVEAGAAIEALTNGTFTVSGWFNLNRAKISYGALFSRATSEDPAWGAQFCGEEAGDCSKLRMQTGDGADFAADVSVGADDWVRFDFVYAPDRLTFYLDGVSQGESALARTFLNGSSGRFSIGGFASAAEGTLGANTLNGFIDELRIRAGEPSATERAVDCEQSSDDTFYTRRDASWDASATLQNRWKTYPTASKTAWDEGGEPAAFTLGEPWYGASVLSFRDKSTGEVLESMPTTNGDYRAVFFCPATNGVSSAGGTNAISSLTYSIDFRIIRHRPTHDLGDGNDRILLLNSDLSVADGTVAAQAYNDTAAGADRPYWVHDVDSGYDYTSASLHYNFCGGLRHTYWSRDGSRRLWDLVDVRYGNTYNNADAVFERTGAWEEWDEGLATNMNYLAWNPQGGCLVDDLGLAAEGWHEYAAQAVLCNSLAASINSTLYTNGIGTIYFDAVNSHTDDATNGHYRLVVEMATNSVAHTDFRGVYHPAGVPTDEAIAETYRNKDRWEDGGYVTEVADAYAYADWQPLTMRVLLVNGGTMTELAPTNTLELALAGGGSYTNFYRVYVPVDCHAQARFRIRRTAINPDYTVAKDVRSLILVDNVICSAPSVLVRVEPRGHYDDAKVWRETVGCEGAFLPSYPSVSDRKIYARARATTPDGATAGADMLSSVVMHYRWRYLDQQCTDWLSVDLNPKTLKSLDPISWPLISGDLEYWFEANQSNEYYAYADYSGLGLGLPGYSEEATSVTNRAATYVAETERGDWFTRIRDGKSSCGQIKLFVRRGSLTAEEEEVEMFVARDQVWRGCLLATNAVAGGIYFRLEARDRQDDTDEELDFQYNTNYWHLAAKPEGLPVTGSLVAGTTNDWGNVPCDGATGHLMFQVDESTRAFTVVHADWQDFNGWTDAHKSYFSGSSTDDVTKRGTSPAKHEYLCLASQWPDDVATNVFWNERFYYPSYSSVSFYAPFESATSPNGFAVGEGMWVRGAYADASDESGMALQMAGQGRGHIQLVSPTVEPRGIGTIRFDARIAQSVSPDDFAYYKGSKYESALFLDDYTFLTRAAFDLNANSNFTGNASLSLAAFLQPGESCYEARWEQLNGNISDSGRILGPAKRGQRLTLYRWEKPGDEWRVTELFAATNTGEVQSWKSSLAPNAIPQAHSISNGLMPFYVGAYAAEDYTLVVAAIHIPGGNDAALNEEGVSAARDAAALNSEKGWLYLAYRDASDGRLTCGTYGVLAANCEGVFVRPQYQPSLVTWESDPYALETKVWPNSEASTYPACHFLSASLRDCAEDLVKGRWKANGRIAPFYQTSSDCYNGLRASVVTQTVDVYTAPIGTTSWSETPVASCTLTGFGRPGVLQGVTNNLWSAEDSSVRIRAGGKITGARTDVVVDNIQITQWRGDNWLGTDANCGLTNFVYTSGWIADGALELSPRRTPDNYPSSLRVPLCDGGGTRKNPRGIGLGSFWIEYRNAQTNANLLVQIATNGVDYTNLRTYTFDPGSDSAYWTTITNWDFSSLPSSGTLGCDDLLGLHGVKGTLRVIVDPSLRAKVRDLTDPTAFGSVEIVQAYFRDEPALDKGCWWGFNIRTVGDASDVEQRMYLPDNPLRRVRPPLDQYGLSLALNNSITEDCDPEALAQGTNPFRDHMPFLQTPTFSSNVVGEVSFRARKYGLQKGTQCAEVTLYGTRAQNVDDVKDSEWDRLNIFIVSNTTYETYRFRADGNTGYRAFRFGVRGVDGVTWPGGKPVCGDEPVRVLLDDVLVSESVRARIAFRNVGAFRHSLKLTTAVPNVPSVSEQPICREAWGVQAEIYSAMLGEEIDRTDEPRVRLHYYKGLSPWGYEQWKSKATSAWLTQATDTNTFYRSSSTDSPGAIIPMSDSGEYVQYMLEVVYTVLNSETGARSVETNWLESADWPVPSWYYPVDFNATLGGGSDTRFAAFAILDSIAPGWAWINEINLFGAFDASFQNSDRNRQFVEVVKPVDYDLDGWELRMLAAKSYGTSQTRYLTNTVATFGREVPSQKSGGASCSYMSFIVVGNPTSEWTGEKYDGAWTFPTLDNMVFNAGGELGSYYPVALQLVRPSGVIEHEVAVLGTNAYESVATSIAWQYSSTNMVAQLRLNAPDSAVFAVPDDNTSTATSVGIFGEDSARDKTALCWNNTMKLTPGDLNEGQEIDDAYPRPGGELILIFASVDTSFGHIVQTVGAGTNTTETQTISMESGSESGKKIEYAVDPWCELGTVTETEDGLPRIPIIATNGVRKYTVTVGRGATKTVRVTASATVDGSLRKYGIDENNRYTPAVLHWLQGGSTLDGPFYDTTSCEIKLAKFLALSGNVITNMTLTQMYWLDMDPTAGEMYFRAGMVRPPSQVVVDTPTYDPSEPQAVTNLRVGVYMSISNGNGHASYRDRSVWAPYVLRGLGAGETSWDYSSSGTSSGGWTSETFKVTGFLNNGQTRTDDVDAWTPLRYFVFWANSFDANYEAEIDVADPFSPQSPAYSRGWHQWSVEHGGLMPPVYMSWNIDERLQPITAEILAPTNRLDGTK